MKAGVKELKELCVFLALCVTAEQEVAADGKVDLSDAPKALAPLMALPAALAGVTEVPAEIKDLDVTEAEELRAAIAANLNLENDSAEQVVEMVLGAALQLAAAALMAKAG